MLCKGVQEARREDRQKYATCTHDLRESLSAHRMAPVVFRKGTANRKELPRVAEVDDKKQLLPYQPLRLVAFLPRVISSHASF